MATAFQASAFQNNAFQIGLGAPIDAIGSPGIGAVIDFRGIERRQRAEQNRETEWRNDLRRAIDEAFDGKPPKAADSLVNDYMDGIEPEPDTQWLYDLLDATTQRKEADRIAANNRLALELLLMEC